MSHARDLLGDMAKYLPAQIAPAVVGLATVSVLTHRFDPTSYGYYTLIMGLVANLTALMGWLPMAVIRYYPNYQREARLPHLLGNVQRLGLTVTAALCLAAAGAVLVAQIWMPRGMVLLAWAGVGAVVTSSLYDLLRSILRARRDVALYSGFAIWHSAGGLAVGLLLVAALRTGIHGFVLGGVLATLISLPFMWRLGVRGIAVPRVAVDGELARRMAAYGFPLVAGNLAAWILSLSDRYLLDFFLGPDQVGVYSASYSIADRSVALLGALFLMASGPIGMQIWERGDEQRSREFLNTLTRYYLLTVVPAVAGLAALSGPIARIFLGAEFHAGHRVIPLVACGVMLLGLQQRFQAGFLYKQKTKFIPVAIAIAGLINIGLNVWLIPRYGSLVAAVTTLVAYACLLVMMVIGSRRHFIWPFPWAALARSVGAAAVMGLLARHAASRGAAHGAWGLLAVIALSVPVYGLVLAATGELRPELRALLQHLRR